MQIIDLETKDLNITQTEAIKDPTTLVARVFAAVAAKAIYLVEYYHGDLARDTLWLRDHASDLLVGTHFYWGFRSTGTSLSQDKSFVLNTCSTVFAVEVKPEDKWGDKWMMLKMQQIR